MSQSRQLSKREKLWLRTANRGVIQQEFADLSAGFHYKNWIRSKNRYSNSKTTIQKLDSDIKSLSINDNELRAYIAASTVVHCADGWAYLGRACNAALSGDPGATSHLAYYAELRAAMSLLATVGIGVFSGLHIAVDNAGKCNPNPTTNIGGTKRTPIPTHQFVWLALEHWGRRNTNASLMSDIVVCQNYSLAQWLQAFNASTSIRILDNKWLANWGIDLRHLSLDREVRNHSSYRPDLGKIRRGPSPLDLSALIRDLWRLSNPSGLSSFVDLDLHLVRISLEDAFLATTGSLKADDPINFEIRLDSALDALGIIGHSRQRLRSFLLSNTEPDTAPLIVMAKGRSTLQMPTYHLEVLARSALLLRLATGLCEQLMMRTGIDSAKTKFWWDKWAVERGIWSEGTEPENNRDISDDVRDVMEDVVLWEDSQVQNGLEPDLASWRASQAQGISTLCQCERILLWGLFK